MSHIKSDSPEPLRVVGAVMRNIRGEVLCALRAPSHVFTQCLGVSRWKDGGR